jgi:hypothetical protein
LWRTINPRRHESAAVAVARLDRRPQRVTRHSYGTGGPVEHQA